MILRAAPTSTALNSLLHRQRKEPMARAKIMVTLTCEHCGDTFRLQRGHYDSRTRAAGHPPKYCSRFCMGAANRVPEVLRTCQHCGGEFVYQPGRRATGTPRKRGKRFCSHECMSAATSVAAVDPDLPGYTRGRRRHTQGYVLRRRPDGTDVKEHTAVMEKILGRKLYAHENVHHLNGNRADNRPENLELWSSSQPPGQRVSDKLEHAAALLRQYGVIGAPPTCSEAVAGLAAIG